ncbi:MAG: ATP-binding protein [Clostridiales bacterium]|nr:ATP-binding protein [Clostridiales bacterium]
MDLLTDIELKLEPADPDVDRYPDRDKQDICPARYMKRGGSTANPMLCALPFPVPERQIRENYYIQPPGYDREEISQMYIPQKIEGLSNLHRVFAPLSVTPRISQVVAESLYKSYAARDIRLDIVNSGKQPFVCSCTSLFGGSPPFFVIFGESGCGKTMSMQLVYRMYPRAIRHVFRDFECVQIPIIYVTAMNEAMLGLLRAIARQVDEILGMGDYWSSKMRGKRTVADACDVVKAIVRRHMVGLIVIDEAEFLPFTGNSSIENIIGISAETGCAIGMIGNYDLIPKYDKYTRLVRRSMGSRIDVSCTGEVDRKYFRKAVEFLWQFQWTRQVTPLTDGITDELCIDSMYNISILIRLMEKVQGEFINKSSDALITEQDIHRVAEEQLVDIRTQIFGERSESERRAVQLASKNQKKLTKADEKKEQCLLALTKLDDEKAQIESVWGETKYWEVERILHDTHNMTSAQAKRAVNKLMLKQPDIPDRDIPFIVAEVVKLVDGAGKKTVVTSKRGRKKKPVDPEDEELVRNALNADLEGVVNG